jgi:FkbM family methyltransferase
MDFRYLLLHTYLPKIIRSNFFVYLIIRKFAKHACRFFILEDGFIVLSHLDREKIKNKVLIDVGSNDGTSHAMIRQFCKRELIVSFDPVRNMKTKSAHIHHRYALGDTHNQIRIYVPKVKGFHLTQYSSNSKIGISRLLARDLGVKGEDIKFSEISAEVRPLDSFDLNPSFIKIDVEGQELLVLKGSTKTITEFNPILLIEINSIEMYSEISQWLGEFDYFSIRHTGKSWKVIKNPKYNPTINNYVFISPKSQGHIQMKIFESN